MQQTQAIQYIVSQAKHNTATQQDLAVVLHNYVRDKVLFGFTPYFDAAKPEQTLSLGVGHCNPQARLMVALFREAGISARFRPVTINNEVLRGAVETPARLSHVFTEVKVANDWIRLDSYIVDPQLRSAAVRRLNREERVLGYGAHVSATGEWDGESNAYSQVATQDMILELHEPVEDIDEFYRSPTYLHRAGKAPFSVLMAPAKLFKTRFSKVMNHRIERLRSQS